MNTKSARASLVIAGFASISIALMAAFSGNTPQANAASPARQPQVIATFTDLPPAPSNTPVPPPPGAATATAVIPVPGGGEIPRFGEPYVFKSADVAQVMPGGTINFTIVVGNRGNVDAVNVQVRDTLPAYLDLVSVTSSKGTVTINGRGFLVDIGTVGVTELITIKVTATANSTMVAGACTNVAVLTTTSGGNNPINDTSYANYVCGEVVNPPTGGASTGPGNGLIIALLAGGLLMIGASFVLSGSKSASESNT